MISFGTCIDGQMTPRVLRIASLIDDKLIEERIVDERISVTIGPSLKNLFSLLIDALRLEFTMFAMHNQYSLRFLSEMDGRLSDGSHVYTLDKMKKSAQRNGEYWSLIQRVVGSVSAR
jgi:hypothetical protein